MQPLKVTAYVAGSIAIARPEDIALDGLLSYQALRRHFGDDFYNLPDAKECLHFARLPLAMRGSPSPLMVHAVTGMKWIEQASGLGDTSLWYWACSRAQIEVKGRDTQYWNKRFDTQSALSDHINFGGKVEKIIIEAGRYKAYHMPLPTLVTDKVTWYADGDMHQIADLLCPISAMGKKRAQGQGMILRWEIVPIAEDYSEWKDDKLMRPIPGPLAKDITPLDLQYIAFRAPQWHSANQAMCVVKGVKSEK
jgi:CRISPR type IV-associated protein Csf3